MTKKKQRGEFSLPFILLSRKKVFCLTKRAFDDDNDSPNLPFRRSARFFSQSAFLDAGTNFLLREKQHQQQKKKITLSYNKVDVSFECLFLVSFFPSFVRPKKSLFHHQNHFVCWDDECVLSKFLKNHILGFRGVVDMLTHVDI